MRVLQHLIEKYTIIGAAIAFDMVFESSIVLKGMFNVKVALLCVFKGLNFARQAFRTHFDARQVFRESFSACRTISVAPVLSLHILLIVLNAYFYFQHKQSLQK